MKIWYSITAKGETQADISIFGPIGNTWDGEGVTARKFVEDFQAIKAPNVHLSINSPGGSLFDGLTIYTAMAGSGKNITAQVMGVAASAASVLLMAAGKITMPKNTHLMVHKAGWVAAGNADELRTVASTLDSLDESIAATYAARTGKTVDEIKTMLNNGDTWMNADEAVAAGFADEATPLVSVTAKFELDKLPEHVRAAMAPPAPPPPAAPALADSIKAMAEAAGLAAHASAFALDPSLATVELAQAAINQAREVQQLAGVAGKPEMAAKLITDRKTFPEAQALLAAALAAEDEANPVSNTPAPTGNKPGRAGLWPRGFLEQVNMTTKTQGFLTGEWLISEADGTRSRDTATATVTGALALPSGTVMGKITATGKWVKHTTGAADGSQNAAAILLTELPGVNADYPVVLFTRDTEAISAVLNGGTGPLSGAAAALLALGIVLR